jgi:hypothetical protein
MYCKARSICQAKRSFDFGLQIGIPCLRLYRKRLYQGLGAQCHRMIKLGIPMK